MSSSSCFSYGLAKENKSSKDEDPLDNFASMVQPKSTPQTAHEWLAEEKKVRCFRWCYDDNHSGIKTLTYRQERLLLAHNGNIIYWRMLANNDILWTCNPAWFIDLTPLHDSCWKQNSIDLSPLSILLVDSHIHMVLGHYPIMPSWSSISVMFPLFLVNWFWMNVHSPMTMVWQTACGLQMGYQMMVSVNG